MTSDLARFKQRVAAQKKAAAGKKPAPAKSKNPAPENPPKKKLKTLGRNTAQVNFRVPVDLATSFRERCDAEGLGVSEKLRDLMEEWVGSLD